MAKPGTCMRQRRRRWKPPLQRLRLRFARAMRFVSRRRPASPQTGLDLANPHHSRLAIAASRTIDRACRITGIARRQLHVDRCELDRLAWPSKGALAAKFLEFFHAGAARDLQRCPDGTRRNAADADALGRKLL